MTKILVYAVDYNLMRGLSVLVSELEDQLSRRQQTVAAVDVADLEVDSLCRNLTIGGETYPFDEIAEKSLAKFLNVPLTYLKRCEPPFRAGTLNHWIEHFAEAEVMVETVGNQIVSMHAPEIKVIPLHQIGQMVARNFAPDDTVAFHADDTHFHMDVVAKTYSVDVPNPDKRPFRPEVGDITYGGIRFLTYPHTTKAPAVLPYVERYVCTNGMTTEESLGRIVIKGNTVPEIIDAMEFQAQYWLQTMDDRLARYAHTAHETVPGNPQAFVLALAHERKLTQGVVDEIMKTVNQLGDDASVYDINQAITAVANMDVNYATRNKLQTLGGSLAFNSAAHTQRCRTCEQFLR
jgi:hypothetical protein